MCINVQSFQLVSTERACRKDSTNSTANGSMDFIYVSAGLGYDMFYVNAFTL